VTAQLTVVPSATKPINSMRDWLDQQTTEALVSVRESVIGDERREIDLEITRREIAKEPVRKGLNVY
jgi:hypothetical protein